MDTGAFALTLSNDKKYGNRYFEIDRTILPRFFLVAYETGLRSISLNLENPRESRPAHSAAAATASPRPGYRTITVDVSKASMTSLYMNGTQIVTSGSLKCVLLYNPEGGATLLIDRIEFVALEHTEYISRAAMVPREAVLAASATAVASNASGVSGSSSSLMAASQDGSAPASSGAGGGVGGEENGHPKIAHTPVAQAPTPSMTPGATTGTTAGLSSNGKGKGVAKAGGEEGGGEGGATGGADEAAAVSPKEPESFVLPVSAVNDFGIPFAQMRCLEVSAFPHLYRLSRCRPFED